MRVLSGFSSSQVDVVGNQGMIGVNMHSHNADAARPLDALLASYAAGTLSRPLHALVASHLELLPQSRRFVAALEADRAIALDQENPAPLTQRDAALEAIFAVGDDTRPAGAPSPSPDPIFPAALHRYLGFSSHEIKWRFRMPGLKECHIEDSAGGEVSLLWVRSGRRLPSHTHEGQEVTLLLKGGFTDPLGHYRRGDIAIADSELDHHPTADMDEDCICLAITDAPLTLTGPMARLFRRLARH
jgi:putative transcriptional regulator